MSTEIISLKDCRKNLSQVWKRSRDQNIQFIVMVNSKPSFKISPIQETDNYSYSFKELEKNDDFWEKLYDEYLESWKNWKEDACSLKVNKNIKKDDFVKILDENLWN